MRRGLVLLWAVPFLLRGQPPAITQEGVRNLASQMPPSLPGGALSPGALFSVRGLRLSGSTTRVVFRQGDSDREAQVVRAEAEYLEARVPMGIGAGPADLLVVRDGASSRPFHLRIAPGASGIFAENGKGWGPGGPASFPGGPGAIQVTGLAQTRAVEVWVGGVQASKVSVAPRAERAGVEDVHFTLANDTPLGCYVPVLMQTSGGVSNAVTIAVARKGESCPDSSSLGTGADALLLLAKLIMHVRLAGGASADFTEDIGAAIFPQNDESPLFTGWKELPPDGTCTAYSGNWISDSSSHGLTDYLFQSAGRGHDAGSEIRISGPAGSATLRVGKDGPGIYSGELGGGLPFARFPMPRFLEKGLYHFSGGGAEIGPIAVDVRYPTALKWIDPAALDTIDRAQGATVRWRGVSPDTRVLWVAANVDALAGGMGMCLCVAPGAAGRQRIPPMMLANIPASQDIPGIPMNYVFAGLLPGKPQRFHARGVENGVALATSLQGRTVTFR